MGLKGAGKLVRYTRGRRMKTGGRIFMEEEIIFFRATLQINARRRFKRGSVRNSVIKRKERNSPLKLRKRQNWRRPKRMRRKLPWQGRHVSRHLTYRALVSRARILSR